MSDFIPQELFVDILKWLPVEDLIRWLTVCKSWYSLITSPSFISLHTQNRSSAVNNNGLLLVRSCDVRFDEEHYSIRFDNDTIEEYKSLNFPFQSWNKYFRVVGSFNGVVCLSDDHLSCKSTIILWNPSIRKSVTLPTPVYNQSIGFAFCAATNDFKVVRVFRLESDMGYVDKVPPELEVYDLSKGCWRSVDPKGFPHIVHPRCPQAYLNGAVHWTGSSQIKRGDGHFNVIVSFDMGTDELGVIEMPDCVAHDDWGGQPSLCVSVLGGSLSLIHYISSVDFGNICNIWVMKEYGKPESWTRMFTIDLDRGMEGAFGFLRNGQVLVTIATNPWNAFDLWVGFKLASYDPKSKQMKHLGINGDAKAFYVDTFVETLALLGLQEARSDDREDRR